MRRRRRHYLAAVLYLAACASCTGDSKPSTQPPIPDGWVEVNDAQYGAHFELPGTAERSEARDQSLAGVLESVTYTTSTADRVEYAVVMGKMPPGEPSRILDGVQRAVVGGFTDKVSLRRELSLDGHPGREMLIEHPRAWILWRGYLVGDTLFQLIIAAPENPSDDPRTGRFFEGFGAKRPATEN